MIEFKPWPKTPRLFREVVITEKIDGSNAAIGIQSLLDHDLPDDFIYSDVGKLVYVGELGIPHLVYAQSRRRIITPKADNYGFAAWVNEYADSLANDLGVGMHYGEWWGAGINRNYGMPGRQLSLFNTSKWGDASFMTPQLDCVPVISTDTFSTGQALNCLALLRVEGSLAAPGFMNPEGVCIYHTASNQVYKALIENDHLPKGITSA